MILLERGELVQVLALVVVGFLGFDAIIAAIWQGLKWVAEKAVIIAEAVAIAVAKAARYAWNGLKWFGGKVKEAAYWLRDRAAGLARWWKDRAAPWLARTFAKVGDFLKRQFGWLQTWVRRIQHILTWLYVHVLKPIFMFLEITRGVLRVLAALGVKWAARLEAWLRNLEARLLNIFNSITNVVNQIGDLLDALFDPTGAFKRKYFVWSYIRWIGDVAALNLLAQIDRNPWPEALRLAEGPDPADIRARGNFLRHNLEAPEPWVILAGRDLRDLLV